MTTPETTTLIGSSMTIRGEFHGTEELQVEGQIEGVVRLATSRLIVRPKGIVKASVMAQDVIVMGRIEGEVRATGRVELRAGAVVVGDVFAARLSMEDGAVLHGQVDPSRAAEGV